MNEQPPASGADSGAKSSPETQAAPAAPPDKKTPAPKARDRSAPPADPKAGDSIDVFLMTNGPRILRAPGVVTAVRRGSGPGFPTLDALVTLHGGKETTVTGIVPEPEHGASIDNPTCRFPCWGPSSLE